MLTIRQFTAANPARASIISEKEFGGGTISMPILGAGTIKGDLTTGGGEDFEANEEMFDQIVENFALWPGPIPIGVHPHKKISQTAGASLGFIDRIFKGGDGDLWAEISVSSFFLWFEIKEDMWRGFSVDIAEDVELPQATLNGWVVLGGVFTNRPATDVHFKLSVAAEKIKQASIARKGVIQLSLDTLSSKEVTVDLEARNKELEAALKSKDEFIKQLTASKDDASTQHGKKVEQLDGRIKSLTQELTDANIKVINADTKDAEYAATAQQLTAQLADKDERITQLTADLAGKDKELGKVKAGTAAVQIKRLANKGIKAGMTAGFFDGVEDDPNEWLKAKGLTVAGLENVIEQVTGLEVKGSTSTVSSRPSGDPEDDDLDPSVAKLSADEQKRLKTALGREPVFAGAATESEARALGLGDKSSK